MNRNYYFLLLLFSIGIISCGSTKQSTNKLEMNTTRIYSQGPQAIVYKTLQDFSNNVPIIMNADRTQIESFPSPADVKYRGKLAKPTQLKNGYWLDNRGITQHVVFTSYTYEEYSQLKEAPSVSVLLDKIIDMYPLLEMYHCGLRSELKNEVEELNALIEKDFEGCEKVVKITRPVLQVAD